MLWVIAFRDKNMVKPDDINRIRPIFLHPEPRVTVPEAAHMLGWSSGRMNEAMRDGEIDVAGTCRSSCAPKTMWFFAACVASSHMRRTADEFSGLGFQ